MSSLSIGINQPAELQWYAVQTRTAQESKVANTLDSKGYEHYLPTYSVRRKWSDRFVNVDLPLFPGYVFIRFNPLFRTPILTTPAVMSIVCFGNTPAAISEVDIQAVKSLVLAGFRPEPCPYLREGQRVRICCGLLKGLEGVLVQKRSELRLVISIETLQRSISVEVQRDWLALA
jgi:transcription antitermination factor NusG